VATVTHCNLRQPDVVGCINEARIAPACKFNNSVTSPIVYPHTKFQLNGTIRGGVIWI